MFRFSPWLVLLGVTSLPLSASPVTSCGVQPSGQTCTSVTTSLTPYPTITVEASATDAVVQHPQFLGNDIEGLTFDFEVLGPPTVAVPVDVLPSGVFQSPGQTLGAGWFCESRSFPPFSIQCSAAQIISPGWYLNLTIFPQSPLMTGSIDVPQPWLVPNEWNEATIGAATGVVALSSNPDVSVSLDSFTYNQHAVDH